MKITRLSLQNFGIFEDQVLTDLDHPFVVVGGKNRAGKSTMFQALRYLGYGFPKKSDLLPPPKKGPYRISAELLTDREESYQLLLEGYGEPKVLPMHGAPITTVSSLYQNLDFFSYKNLYTISLDELQRLPKDVGTKERELLTTLLLGGGQKELAMIPEIQKTMAAAAKKIGGESGKAGKLKEYLKEVEEGVSEVERAAGHIAEYEERILEFQNYEKLENGLAKEKESLDSEILRLETLQGAYPGYRSLLEEYRALSYDDGKLLGDPLSPQDAATMKRQFEELKGIMGEERLYQEKKRALCGVPHLAISKELSREIDGLLLRRSSLEERAIRLETEQEHFKKEQLALDEIMKTDLPEGYTEEFLKDLTLDQSVLMDLEEKEHRYETDMAAFNVLVSRENDISSGSEQRKTADGSLKLYLSMGALITVIGVLLSFFSLPVGIPVTIFGIGALAFYLVGNQKKEIALRQEERRMQQEAEQEQLRQKEQLNHLRAEIKELERYFSDLKEAWRLSPNIDPKGMSSYARELLRAQKTAHSLSAKRQNLEEEESLLNSTLRDSLSKISSVPFTDWTQFDTISSVTHWCRQFFRVVDEMKQYVLLEEKEVALRRKSKEKKEALMTLLQGGSLSYSSEEWISYLEQKCLEEDLKTKYQEKKSQAKLHEERLLDRFSVPKVKEVFLDAGHQISDLEDVRSLYQQYFSEEELNQELQDKKEEKNRISEEIRQNQERKLKCRMDLERLSSPEDLDKAVLKTEEAKKKLKPLALQFASLRVGSRLLQELYLKEISQMEHTLLKEGKEYFTHLTGGDYIRIQPSGDAKENNFILEDKSHRILESAEALSRSTKEQLYFSMRLGRIKAMKPSLPILLDDSFTNFDAFHVERLIQALGSLGHSYQIFLFTCHSSMVESIREMSIKSVKYLKLEEGVLEATDGAALARYLSREES